VWLKLVIQRKTKFSSVRAVAFYWTIPEERRIFTGTELAVLHFIPNACLQ
jgi:hypothetical protein